MILTVKMEGISKAAAVLSVLMKGYTILCHDRGHINVMVVLQSCTDSQHILPGLSSEMFPTSSDGTNVISSIEVEENVVAVEEGFLARNEEVAVHIKQEETARVINFPDIKSEPDEVSYFVYF
jgi:hypothetical protein